MKQGDTEVNGPHQGALIDTLSGQEWILHFQDRGLYGRIAHLQPVHWENDWPVIGVDQDAEGCGRPCIVHEKPDMGKDSELTYLEASDEFSNEKLGLQWQWLGNAKRDFSSLTERPGRLRLFALNPSGAAQPILWNNANVLTQKLVCPCFRAETKIELGGLKENGQAGLVMMGGHYAYLAARIVSGKKKLIYAQSYDGEKGMEEETRELGLKEDVTELWLRESLTEDSFTMEYSVDGENYVKADTSFFPTDHTWVGAKIGLFAGTVSGAEPCGYADFDYIHVESLQEE